jgi:CHASE2 domain-containing sensor protein/nitrogen-specific signal transduction histidine kinase
MSLRAIRSLLRYWVRVARRRLRPERRYLLEWVFVGAVGVAIVMVGAMTHAMTNLDRIAYDRLLRVDSRPLLPDIAMVTIDDASIAEFGRWPWPRDLQAQVVRAAAQAGAAAIVYDVLLTESSPDDRVLAGAIRTVPTFLPLLLMRALPGDAGNVVPPVAPFTDAAAGLGHVNLEADGDGIVRSVALIEGDGDAREPYIDVPVYAAIRDGSLSFAGGRYVADGLKDPRRGAHGDVRVLIPFTTASAMQVSCAQLLKGDVPRDALRGKIVFVGVTAAGVNGHLSTPVSGHVGPMPDVAVHAQVLSALLSGRIIHAVPAGVTFAASLVPVAFLLAGFFFLSPWRSLVLTSVLGIAVTAASAIALRGADIWVSPVPAAVAVIVLYPIWSWRRLEMTMSRLRHELKQLDDDVDLLPVRFVAPREFGGDVLERQIALVERAAHRLQDMKRFVWDSLNSVPEPVLVADGQGIVLLANQAARAHFARLGGPELAGRTLTQALGGFSLTKSIDTSPELEAEIRASWPAVLDPTGRHVGIVRRGIEVRDRMGHEYLLRYERCRNQRGEESGSWVAGMVEVTALHAAERGREDALRLLSHDMRSRHASILALIELERSNTESERTRVLLERIERHAQRALKLADDFVQLARAESQAYSLEPVNLVDAVIDASDEIWPQARAKDIRVEMKLDGNEYWIAADRSLMTRAIANVLNNAVKYSPSSTVIAVGVSLDASRRVRCTVRDEGYGIPKDMQAHLFEPFRRFHSPGQPPTNGAGLGMAFIKAVVVRHGGEVQVDSAPGQGTTVTIRLPVLDSAAMEAMSGQ